MTNVAGRLALALQVVYRHGYHTREDNAVRIESKTGRRYRAQYDSLAGFIDHVAGMADYRTETMIGSRVDRFFGGITSMTEAIELARTGLAADGIEALRIADENLEQFDRDLVSQQFQTVYDVCGSDVDVARYLSGEPENMISYHLDDMPQVQRIVTLVVSGGAPGSVSASAITKHGQRIMSLMMAIESTGIQTEIWVDHTSTDRRGGYTGRESVRIKAPGELFDASAFMFAITHPSMLRALFLNSMHAYPPEWQSALKVGNGYGNATNKLVHADDYPDGSIYIPGIMLDSEAGLAVDAVLREIGLLAD